MPKVMDRSGFCCPYCNTLSASAPDEGGRLTCDDCGKEFVGWVETDIVFYTRDLEGGKALRDFLERGK